MLAFPARKNGQTNARRRASTGVMGWMKSHFAERHRPVLNSSERNAEQPLTCGHIAD
jgi:hypothetical protein